MNNNTIACPVRPAPPLNVLKNVHNSDSRLDELILEGMELCPSYEILTRTNDGKRNRLSSS